MTIMMAISLFGISNVLANKNVATNVIMWITSDDIMTRQSTIDWVIKHHAMTASRMLCWFIPSNKYADKRNADGTRISANMWSSGILFLQYLHLPRRQMKLISGIKSRKPSLCPQKQQTERPEPLPVMCLLSLNNLHPMQLAKLPKMSPINTDNSASSGDIKQVFSDLIENKKYFSRVL